MQMYSFRMRRPLPQPFRRIITKAQTLVQRDSCLCLLTIRTKCLRLLLLNASFRNTSALTLHFIQFLISVPGPTRSPCSNPGLIQNVQPVICFKFATLFNFELSAESMGFLQRHFISAVRSSYLNKVAGRADAV